MNKVRNFLRSVKIVSRQPLPRKILFTHLPKAAGTSFRESILYTYSISNVPDYVAFRKACTKSNIKEYSSTYIHCLHAIILYYKELQSSFVADHFPVNEMILNEFIASDYLLVTILREPLERFVSQYSYHRLRLDQQSKQSIDISNPAALERDFHEYIASLKSTHRLNLMAWFFGNDTNEVAFNNLLKYDVVGFTGELENFNAKMTQVLGRPLPMRSSNITIERFEPAKVKFIKTFFESPETKQQLLEALHEEIELYAQIKSHFSTNGNSSK